MAERDHLRVQHVLYKLFNLDQRIKSEETELEVRVPSVHKHECIACCSGIALWRKVLTGVYARCLTVSLCLHSLLPLCLHTALFIAELT